MKDFREGFFFRFDTGLGAQLRILAAMEGIALARLIRTLLVEALEVRQQEKRQTMSRQIDTNQPLSEEDQQYLDDRGLTVEQYSAQQEAEAVLRYDGPVVGDPNRARVRKARQL